MREKVLEILTMQRGSKVVLSEEKEQEERIKELFFLEEGKEKEFAILKQKQSNEEIKRID